MTLSWNEIKARANEFAKEWENTICEEADAKPFLDAFFAVFGITRKKIGTFEYKVKKLDNHDGYIDLFWKKTLLIEMKSTGKDLDKAYVQAKEYLQTLPQHELPHYILLCNFKTFRLIDLEYSSEKKFTLTELVKNIQHFGFIAGYQQHTYKEQDPVNVKAAMLMGKLHDKLKDIGYTGHALELFLVRILFCLFADNTTLFEKDAFLDFITQRTNEDGSDLAARLNELFFILNKSKDKRLKNLDEQLNTFPFVNGKLFEETLPPASFDSGMRRLLLECCYLNWGQISPAIFGSMFQSVMDKDERRNLGAHYTSETNILKLIKSLFLDELRAEFEKVKDNKHKLNDFHKKLGSLKFLDPACGCGNFLVITYRELRLLEIDILRELFKGGQAVLNISDIIWLDVDMMYGIEIEEFPAQIAQVALWLIDHQMNMKISVEFGQYFSRLPLIKSATIVHGNAIRTDWQSLLNNGKTFDYILGNPPFSGARLMTAAQKSDMEFCFEKTNEGVGSLDLVCAWYKKAAVYLSKYQTDYKIKCAFVSTNSISQGEQVPVLWMELSQYDIFIHFAHQTFKWTNEAAGKAAVYCVIIGFSNFDIPSKELFVYEDIKGDPHKNICTEINGYLINAPYVLISKRSKPISKVPNIVFGNMPNDGGNFLFTKEEKEAFLMAEPNAIKLFRTFISAHEFLHGEERFCLWLQDITPDDLKNLPLVRERIDKVKKFRKGSTRKVTQLLAEYSMSFGEIRQPASDYLLIPRVSSENRKYIPIGFFTKEDIVSDTCLCVPEASLFHFGVLTSFMHMTWVKYVCGRLKSDFRYSNTIVYNNYPFPTGFTAKQKAQVEMYAQEVLDNRKKYKSTLATLYDPILMPNELTKSHIKLDKAIDKCYSDTPFTSELQRIQFLFCLYQGYTSDLFTMTIKDKKKKSKTVQLNIKKIKK